MLSKTLLSLLKIRYIGYVVNTFNQGSSYFVTEKPQKRHFFTIYGIFSALASSVSDPFDF